MSTNIINSIMTLLEFYGCAMIALGPALSMFCLTVAQDPIKVILFITAAFCWLVSFVIVAICWACTKPFGKYLFIHAILSVIVQECFRYLFHTLVKKAQNALGKMIGGEGGTQNEHDDSVRPAGQQQEVTTVDNNSKEFNYRISLSYVSGLGYGVMSGTFAIVNVLSDSIGPGTIGLKGDSPYFFIISAMTTLAFILLNVCWSVMMAGGIEKSDKKLLKIVVIAHLIASLSVSNDDYSSDHYDFVHIYTH